MKKRILIAGGNGFLGRVLENYFKSRGYLISILTRNPRKSNHIYWDGETYGEWIHILNQSHILINLAGKSVNCRYNRGNKALILQSRIKSTQILGQAIKISKTPPKLWINSSTATIYEHSEKVEMTEKEGCIGDDFSMNVAKAWENTVLNLNIPTSVRQVFLRTSVVLGKRGEAFKTYNRLVKLGLGGYQGSGNQMVSWIHEIDFARGVEHLINSNESGPVNLTAPYPVDNKIFMKEFRGVHKKTVGLIHPKFILKIGAFIIGTEVELLLKSRNVVPERLLNMGFNFKFPKIDMALKDLNA